MIYLAQVPVNMEEYYTCGGFNVPFSGSIPYLIHTLVVIIKIAVPVLLIIFGMLDLGKAVVASKEDEIKKGQQMFIKRAVAAVIVFFVIQVVQLLARFVSGSDSTVVGCLNCFANAYVQEGACVVDKTNGGTKGGSVRNP